MVLAGKKQIGQRINTIFFVWNSGKAHVDHNWCQIHDNKKVASRTKNAAIVTTELDTRFAHTLSEHESPSLDLHENALTFSTDV